MLIQVKVVLYSIVTQSIQLGGLQISILLIIKKKLTHMNPTTTDWSPFRGVNLYTTLL